MSMIVVEGVDASGKSTLLENVRLAVKKRYFIMLRHSCRPLSVSDAEAFMDVTSHASKIIGLDVIVDRHPLISEPIYGPILRGTNLMAGYASEQIEGILRSEVDRIIYCRPSLHDIESNLRKKPQLSGVRENIVDLIRKYDQTMARFRAVGIPVFEYNYLLFPEAALESLFFGDVK